MAPPIRCGQYRPQPTLLIEAYVVGPLEVDKKSQSTSLRCRHHRTLLSGEYVAIVGEQGVGKATSPNVVAGLAPTVTRAAWPDDENLAARLMLEAVKPGAVAATLTCQTVWRRTSARGKGVVLPTAHHTLTNQLTGNRYSASASSTLALVCDRLKANGATEFEVIHTGSAKTRTLQLAQRNFLPVIGSQ